MSLAQPTASQQLPHLTPRQPPHATPRQPPRAAPQQQHTEASQQDTDESVRAPTHGQLSILAAETSDFSLDSSTTVVAIQPIGLHCC